MVGLGALLMPTMTYLQAISDAMREEMRADEPALLQDGEAPWSGFRRP